MLRNAQTDEEKLHFLLISSNLMYAVTEEKAVGFYEMQMLDDFREIAVLYFRLGDRENGTKYFSRLKKALHRHVSKEALADKNEFVNSLAPHGYIEYWKSGFSILDKMKNQVEFSEFTDEIHELTLKYHNFYEFKKGE